MPLYEYECESCHKVFEVMQKFSDEPLSECPECKGIVKKIMSRTSFALKGSGWYTTDYKRASAPAATVPSPSSKTEGQSAQTAPSPAPEAKPAAAAPSTPTPPKVEPKSTSGKSE